MPPHLLLTTKTSEIAIVALVCEKVTVLLSRRIPDTVYEYLWIKIVAFEQFL